LFGGSAMLATSMYFVSILSVGVGGAIIKKLKITKQNCDSFIMEIPLLRLPKIKDLRLVLLEKTKDFITKAGLIVFVLSVCLWSLRNLGVSGYVGDKVEESFLYVIGNSIKSIFYPLGFDNWQASVAIICGFMAKEAVIETLGLLCETPNELFSSVYSVYAFCVFILLSPPCIASIAQAYRELNSVKKVMGMLVFQFAFAYAVALAINLFGVLMQKNLILPIIIVIIIIVSVIFSLKKLKSLNKCKGCALCVGDNKCNKTEKRSTT
jgi:ferrous iron transport protein B